MTHGELETKIELILGTYISINYGSKKNVELRSNLISSLQALRAVVELHKPCQIKNSMTYCEGCSNSAFFPWDSCPTIQAIEKELG
jgi:hypothetical protein